jgi:3-hydroxyisobutyrate dehydrogenase
LKIGFIGLGVMGGAIASNLRNRGYQLVVHDLKEAAARHLLSAGAQWASSPREVAEQVDLVFTSLPTPASIEAVANGPDGLRAGFRPGKTWVDLSTNSAAAVRRLHAMLAEEGVKFLDAPVSGGIEGASSGKRFALWIGGDESAYQQYASIFSDMGDQARYIGAIGAGTIAKLTHNMATLAIDTVIAEVLTLGVKAGVELPTLYSAMRAGAVGRERSFDNLSYGYLTGEIDPPGFKFDLYLAHKDAQLALELAREAGVPMKLCALTALEISEAMNRGWARRHYHSYLSLQQERAGLPPLVLSESELDQIRRES